MTNVYLMKVASAVTKAEGLGKYMLHNAVVPGAVIFGADLGAHAAAEKLVHSKDDLKKVAKVLLEIIK